MKPQKRTVILRPFTTMGDQSEEGDPEMTRLVQRNIARGLRKEKIKVFKGPVGWAKRLFTVSVGPRQEREIFRVLPNEYELQRIIILTRSIRKQIERVRKVSGIIAAKDGNLDFAATGERLLNDMDRCFEQVEVKTLRELERLQGNVSGPLGSFLSHLRIPRRLVEAAVGAMAHLRGRPPSSESLFEFAGAQ